MERRKKIGGIKDRRFGESDPTMTPEEKALQRFVRAKQKGGSRNAVFDLEEPEANEQLTHLGQSLSLGGVTPVEDFGESELSGSDMEMENSSLNPRAAKRRRISEDDKSDGVEVDSQTHQRYKSKKVVMEEVIAKSKLEKYERQKAREDDDDLRVELDKGLSDVFAMLRGSKVKQTPHTETAIPSNGYAFMNPDRLALLEGKTRSQTDKSYDERLRQMAKDQRAQPTAPTLTEEIKLENEAQKLEALKEQKLKRMRGEIEDSGLDDSSKEQDISGDASPDPAAPHAFGAFGLGDGLTSKQNVTELDVEDEDQFLIDDGLVISGSDLDSNVEPESDKSDEEDEEDFDDEFNEGLLVAADIGRPGLSNSTRSRIEVRGDDNQSAFTYDCPNTHKQLLEIMKHANMEDLPTIIQRIRASYHPKLAEGNKTKLAAFSAVLVEHIYYLIDQVEHAPFAVLEALIRHIHSLAKAFPQEVGRAFRSHLETVHKRRPDALTAGDLISLTAIGSIFPTSDHFHPVVTPAMLCMTRYLSQKIPQNLRDLATGTYVCTLCQQYQKLARRYVPEAVNYTLNAIAALMPMKPQELDGAFPYRALPETLRLIPSSNTEETSSEPVHFWDIHKDKAEEQDQQSLKQRLLRMHISFVAAMADLWSEKSAFCEMLEPLYQILRLLDSKTQPDILPPETRKHSQTVSQRLHILLQLSLERRKPLRLHNHRPLPIKTSIPKFEETYNPDRHYDPDPERAGLSKLRAEHKKERKAALRELRKDANFMAREALREKKERDRAYETKFKRLVAEIQGEEGHEANLYERGKRLRKGKR